MSARIDTTAAGYLITTPTDIILRHSMADALEYCSAAGLEPIINQEG